MSEDRLTPEESTIDSWGSRDLAIECLRAEMLVGRKLTPHEMLCAVEELKRDGRM